MRSSSLWQFVGRAIWPSASMLIAGLMAMLSLMPHAQDAAQDIQSAIEKANLYIDIAEYTEHAVDSWDRYLGWVNVKTGPTGKERYISDGMYPIDDLSGFLEAARRGAALEPSTPDLDSTITRYLDAYEALFPVMNRANDYYERELYRTDAMTEGRALHAQMVPLVAAFLTEREAMLRELRPFVREVERQEMTAMEEREGRSLAWQTAQVMHAANQVVDLFPQTRPTPIDPDTFEQMLDGIGPNTSGEEFDEIISGVAKPVDVVVDLALFDPAVEEYAEAVDLFERFAAETPEEIEDFKDLPRQFLSSLLVLQESLARSQGRDFDGSGQQVGQVAQIYFSMVSASSGLSRSGLQFLN
ncbi:DUF3829 domain-containing protein [Devosia ginsengisoli]|nr:DUF3829 domain-containing protein [Devosia ginsengisoli]